MTLRYRKRSSNFQIFLKRRRNLFPSGSTHSVSCSLAFCGTEPISAPYFYALANHFALLIFELAFPTRTMVRKPRRGLSSSNAVALSTSRDCLVEKNSGSRLFAGWIEMVCAFRFAFRRCCRDEVISGWSFCRRRVARILPQSDFFIFAGGCRLRWHRFLGQRICIETIGLRWERSQS